MTIGLVRVIPQPCSTLTPIGANSSIKSRGKAEPATSMRLRQGEPLVRAAQMREQSEPDCWHAGRHCHPLALQHLEKRRPVEMPARENEPRPRPWLRNRGCPIRRRDTSTLQARRGLTTEFQYLGGIAAWRRCATLSRDGCKARLWAAQLCPRCSKGRSPCFHRTRARHSPRRLPRAASRSNRGACPEEARHPSCPPHLSGGPRRGRRKQ